MIKINYILLLLSLLTFSSADTWITSGYWYSGSEFPVPDINSKLFTHLICAFAHINSTNYEIYISPNDQPYFSTFTQIVKRRNPSAKTLLSIWAGASNSSVFYNMTNQPSTRNSFITSSIITARQNGFTGLDLNGVLPSTPLILTLGAKYSPVVGSTVYPVSSISRNFDWVHIRSFDYHVPLQDRFFTGAHAALYDPHSNISTDYGVNEWIRRGLPAEKLVLGLPYHGYAWTLVNPNDYAIGAPAKGLAITADGSMSYKYIKWYLNSYGVKPVFNSTYVVNYCKIESFWIGYDDVEAIQAKVTYAKEKGLLGYSVFQIPNDDTDWSLSRTAQEDEEEQRNKRPLLVILLPTTIAAILLLLGTGIYFLKRKLKDPVKRLCLDWPKRVQIIEGITQGLLYLQEYSAVTIIHRDLKASNILLDKEMKPKISDFGIAKIFEKDEDSASTGRIIGTYGYVPPEYVKGGIYSRKYDVYSFGVLILQILSGKKTSCLYGLHKNVKLLEHAYEIWKDNKCMDFMDPSLDDNSSPCKMKRCMQVALLCVQEKWEDRPSMLEVSSMLKSETEIMPTPKIPAFSINKISRGETVYSSEVEVCSANMLTMTQEMPR